MFNPFQIRPAAGDPRKWYEFKAAAEDDTAELRIYDSIGGWFGLTAADFAEDLDKVKASKILLRINSSGGDVFDAFAIYNLLKDHPATITTVVDGVAASAASYIALAGDTVEVHEASVIMIHDPWGYAVGNAADLRHLADILDKTIAVPMAKIYADKMDKTTKEVRELMSSETWYTGAEAVEEGFADVLLSDSEEQEAAAAAVAARDFTAFKNPPAPAAGAQEDPPADPPATIAADAADLIELMKRRIRLSEAE